jgi:hypothetical protein
MSRVFIARSSRILKATVAPSLRIPSRTSRSFATTPQRKNQDLKALWGIIPKTDEKMPNSDLPKHEMVYFKGLATSTRAFGEFRRVLHTGLYSQLVVMEVPVGGEIGMSTSFACTEQSGSKAVFPLTLYESLYILLHLRKK